MPIKSNEDTSDNERQEFFIHIIKLPRLAFQQEIKDFFSGLSVKEDGVMIRRDNAFVAFHKRSDMDVAINRRNRSLLGSEVQLSIISRCELRRILFRLARRKIDFCETDGVCKQPSNKAESAQRKKIRPTPVIRSKKRKTETSQIFYPKELDPPAASFKYDINVKPFSWQCDTEFGKRKKKIHPFKLSDNAVAENFSIFHPVTCFEVPSLIKAV